MTSDELELIERWVAAGKPRNFYDGANAYMVYNDGDHPRFVKKESEAHLHSYESVSVKAERVRRNKK